MSPFLPVEATDLDGVAELVAMSGCACSGWDKMYS